MENWNPFNYTDEKAGAVRDSFALDLAQVLNVEGDKAHQIVYRIYSVEQNDTVGSPNVAPVIADNIGDVTLPSEGDIVAVGHLRGGKPIVLGTIYSRQDSPPSYESDEKVLGHDATDTAIRYAADGTLSFTTDADSRHIEAETDDGHRLILDDENNRVLLESAGGLTVELDDSSGEVVINSGTQGVITDVTGTDSDGSGDIDTINITRDSSILV